MQSYRLFVVEGIDFDSQLGPETKQRQHETFLVALAHAFVSSGDSHLRIRDAHNFAHPKKGPPLETCDTTPFRAAPVAEVSAATNAVIQVVYTRVQRRRLQNESSIQRRPATRQNQSAESQSTDLQTRGGNEPLDG